MEWMGGRGVPAYDELPSPLGEWAEHVDRLQWSALIVDGDWTLQWVSRSLRNFLRVGDDVDLGYGLNIGEAWSKLDVWQRSATVESQIRGFGELLPVFKRAMLDRGRDPTELLAEPFGSLIADLEPATEAPFVWSSSFDYTDPKDPDLPSYGVNFCGFRINDDDGSPIGILFVFFIAFNPNLMTLLVRGDQAMYQRMARLIDPGVREAAILFCDLHRSFTLARTMSTSAYFKLVRTLWTGMDKIVAEHTGIVGKHAGDGASAFFLVDDLGSRSAAVAASIETARRIHELSHEVFSDVLDQPCQMKIGLHWGGSLFMGQLVPGGRLDVTALGDEVNEAARIQECAGPHESLASKQLVERLSADDAERLGLKLERLKYNVISEREGASEKAIKDAGGIAVTEV